MHVFRRGDEGPEVHDIQQRLLGLGGDIDSVELEGRFGPSTDGAVRAFQQRRHLRTDGLVGSDTWGQLVEAGYRLGDRTLYLHSPFFRGDDVRTLQRKLNALGFDAGREDGMFGLNADRALREFQRNVGDEADGIVGLHTIATLERMRPHELGTSRALVREQEELRALRTPIGGRVVAIDPGGAGPGGRRTYDIATTLADSLAAMGAKPVLLRDTDDDPAPGDRARVANEQGAAACISIHLGTDSAGTYAPTCSYFGNVSTHSPAGMLLAQLILAELETALACGGRLRRLSAAMLRETRMPAVLIEPLDADGAFDAARQGGLWASGIAQAVTRGVQRFFSG